MNLVHRKLLMGALVAAFGVQTALVYTDDTADRYQRLSQEAVAGRQLWHDHNCQSCHQIHGFGGFLGPDLTNAGKRLTDERLREVLTVGNAQMPAFHFTEDQILDMAAFLDELSEMGVGVPRSRVPLEPAKVHAGIDQHMAEGGCDEAVQRGCAAFRAHCAACHVPLQATPLGLQTAPDLSTARKRLDAEALRATIRDGRVARGMPAWSTLGEQTLDDLCAFVQWLNDERQGLCGCVGGVDVEQPLPWWEYR